MQIAFNKFVQLTALLAAGGIAPACTLKAADSDDQVGGAANGETGGSSAGSTAQAGNSAAGNNAAGGTNTAAGSTAQAGSSTAGSSAAGTSSSSAGAINDSAAGNNAAGNSAAGASAIAGAAGNSAAGNSAAGNSAAGNSAAGNSAVSGGSNGGNTAAAGASSCIPAGDPVSEGSLVGGVDCTLLPFANIDCGPSSEGLTAYGVQVCETYSQEPQVAAHALFDCLNHLTVPSEGWCGNAHAAQVKGCLSTVAQRTCASTASETACQDIHNRCSAVSIAECRADLSLHSASFVEAVDPCVEGGAFISCALNYKSCLGIPERLLDTTATCATVVAACPSLTAADCATSFWDSPVVYEWEALEVNFCRDAEMAGGSPCDEAFTSCAAVYYGS